MCTVVFIPGGEKKYFASLRDENPQRLKALEPEVYSAGQIDYLCPADAMSGGTWIGVNTLGKFIVLLNGGFMNHSKKSVYRKSRGSIVLALLQSAVPLVDWSLLDLHDIEPFTLILLDDEKLYELVWTGDQRVRKKLDARYAHIWSSSTLYSNEAKQFREAMFREWIITNPMVTKFSLFKFFNATDDGYNGFIINRSEVIKTLSFTFLAFSNNSQASMNYYDLQLLKHTTKTIVFPKSKLTNTCSMFKKLHSTTL